MRKNILFLILAGLLLVGCSSTKEAESETIKVASHTNPMTDMLDLVKEDLNDKGYNLEVVKVSDNVQANIALENGEVDANFFQHEPFMNQFNQGNNGHLVKATSVYNALVSFYSRTADSLDNLKEGAIVAIPNDITNRTRALRMLETRGLISLKDKNSDEIKVEDITENPKNLVFREWDLLNLNEAYQESDLTFNYPTYIEALGLKPEVDGLILEEEADNTFAITVTAREDNINSDKVKALVEVMNSEKIRDFINTKLEGHAKPAF